MHRSAIIGIGLFFLIILGFSSAQSNPAILQVTLTLNDTVSTVFIPGTGETPFVDLPSTETGYTSPIHFYLASYFNNNVKALIISQETPKSISVRKDATNHYLSVNQSLTNSQVFLAFTKGDYIPIDRRMEIIESASFLSEIAPSFSFGLGDKNPIKLILNYSDIDIKGDFIFRQGVHEITIQSNKSGSIKSLIISEII